MRIIIVGGSGFIGKNLSIEFAKLGNEVIIFDKSEPQFYGKNNGICIKYIKGDLTKYDSLENVLTKDDIVIHLISTSFPNNSNINIYNDAKGNILPSLVLLETCVKREVKKVIFASSGGAIYGKKDSIPISEREETNPISSYGIHKLITEKYMGLINSLYGISCVSLRIANPYGIGQHPFMGQGIISTALASAILERKFQIWGSGNAIRDYIYISDVVNAFVKVSQYDGKYSIFNIGSEIGLSINELIEIVEDVVGKKIIKEYVSQTTAEVGRNVLDCTRAKEQLGWQPKVKIQDGIRKMYSEWNEKGHYFGF